jgi:hypothetical protein
LTDDRESGSLVGVQPNTVLHLTRPSVAASEHGAVWRRRFRFGRLSFAKTSAGGHVGYTSY